MKRCLPAALLPLLPCALLAGCRGQIETPLEATPDRVDRPRAGNANAPLKNHPQGLRFRVEGSLVEGAAGELTEQAFHATVHVENRSGREVVFPFEQWSMRDDDGRRYQPGGALLWDDENEEYGPAPRALAPGTRALLVVRFPAAQKIELLHLLGVTLSWRYRHADREHRIATHFRVR